MWPLFFASTFALCLLLIAPGYGCARALVSSKRGSILLAPLFSVAVYEAGAIFASFLGIFINWTFFAALAAFCLISGLLIARRREASLRAARSQRFAKDDLLSIGVYVIAAFVFATLLYVVPLDGPSSFAQDSDNSYHLAQIKAFVDRGAYSALSTGLYGDISESTLVSTATGFYPAAWHMVAAIVESFTGQNPGFAANVANYAMLLCIFPFGILYFVSNVFKNNRKAVLSTAFVMFAFAGFPWGMLISVSGPLFPNAFGYALMPACAGLFIALFDENRTVLERKLYGVAFMAGLFITAISHPNAVFAMALLLAPFVAWQFSKWFKSKAKLSHVLESRLRVTNVLAWLIPVMAIIGVWTACFVAPPLRGTTSFTWATTATPWQALVNALTLTYRLPASNYVLAILVLIGFVALLRNGKCAWLACSYLLAILVYVAGASCTGFLQHFFAGFWYTDPYRLGATASLIAIPLAGVGLACVVDIVANLLRGANSSLRAFAQVAVVLLCVVLLYMGDSSSSAGEISYTGIADYERCSELSNKVARANLFDSDEKRFCEEVSTIVDSSDGLIYNNADDGSAFAYPLYGLNLVYKRSAAEMLGNETDDNKLLRTSINELATSVEVQQVLKKNNIKYILVLDLGGETTDERCYYGYYTWDKWSGINSINDETSGLKTVLSEGDMRLYEIEY